MKLYCMLVIFCSLRAGSGVKVELFLNGDVLDPNEDKRLVSQLAFRDRSVSAACCSHYTLFSCSYCVNMMQIMTLCAVTW